MRIEDTYAISFPFEYGLLDVKGKTVVDVGGYNGDTVAYFLDKGAAHVTVYESNDQYRAELTAKHANDARVSICGAWNGEALPQADVLKMDIEGGEKYLTAELLQQYTQFSIGLHPTKLSEQDFERLLGVIKKLGGRLTWIEGTELVYGNDKAAFRPYYLLVAAAIICVVGLLVWLSKRSENR